MKEDFKMEEKEIGTVSHENLVKDDEAVEKAIKEFGYNIYDLREYDYDLPEELIAQTPAKKRDESKLLVLDKNTGEWVDEPYFKNLLKYLKPGDVIVRNNTKVIPARLFGIKEETKAKVEVLLLRQLKEEDLCDGVHIMSIGAEENVPAILDEAGL